MYTASVSIFRFRPTKIIVTLIISVTYILVQQCHTKCVHAVAYTIFLEHQTFKSTQMHS